MLDYNFFTSYIASDKASKTRTVAITLAFVILFVLIGGFYTVTELVAWTLKKNIAEMQSFLTSEETVQKLREVETKRKKFEVMSKYYSAVEAILNNIDISDKIRSSLIEKVNSTLPSDVVIINIAYTQQGLQIQAEAASRVSAAELEHNLNSLEIFTDVHIGAIQKAGEEEKYTFDIQCTLKGVIEK